MRIFNIKKHFFQMRFNKVSSKELSLIAGNLAQLYKDGIAINDALDLVQEVTLNKEYKNSLSKVLRSIEDGKSLSKAFGEFKELYPEFFIGIISIGENSGKLYEVLYALKNYYSKRVFIRKEVINAITYPIFIFFSLIALIIFLITVVIPNFYDIYISIGSTPPLSCSMLYKFSKYLKDNILVSSISILCWIVLIPVIIVKNLSKRKITQTFKNIKIVKDFFEYMMVLTLSIIMSSGVNISYGLKYCSEGMSFRYLRDKLSDINKNILRGYTLTEAVDDTKAFSRYTIAIVKIREESGSVEEGLKELSILLEDNLTKNIKKYISLLQPFLIIFMASLITIFLIAFILPLFDTLKSGIR
ncbi:type II secretion system F family protein [Clostridium uliginosum]|uniref:Type IV pilus assembly protein PilC n=1 Tax=Clostridium uliginosum TaxID=119641 RepID=A0A1I1NFN6_9CLOT|nr:type II secretion system F family protein [Clostridium uliginosum]SFC96347.1 type IV pilus assembly protein PilC [Clostridium uliginosum]